jgi:predicted metalloprotease with PDZ domain
MLLMYPEGAEKFSAGWAHFVTGLEARDTAGQPVALQSVGRDEWRVSGVEVVDLSYRVHLLHDREPRKWQFGVKEVAYVRPEFAFATGKALFITNLEMPPAVVQIEPPSGERVLTSWSRLLGADNRFRVSGPLELTESVIVVGSPLVRAVQVGNTRVEVVTSPSLASSADAVAGHAERFLPAAAALFGATPPDTLLVVAERDTGYVGGGAAFEGGISLMFPEPLGPANRARWGHVLDHEIVHLWIGHRIRYPDEAPEYWFSEGFTDYATWMLEAGHGLIPEDTLPRVIAEQAANYRRQAGTAPMQAVSGEKAKYYDLIYSGGFLVALALDVEIRARTDLKRGLPDVLRAMYAQFGGSEDTRYTANEVVRVANETCVCDLRPFFEAHVFGIETLPVDEVVERIGVVLPGDAASLPVATEPAGSQTQRLRAAWLGGWRIRMAPR